MSPGTGPHLPNPTWTSESSRTRPCKMEKIARTRPLRTRVTENERGRKPQRGCGHRYVSSPPDGALVPRKPCSAHPGSIRAQLPCHPGSSVTPGSALLPAAPASQSHSCSILRTPTCPVPHLSPAPLLASWAISLAPVTPFQPTESTATRSDLVPSLPPSPGVSGRHSSLATGWLRPPGRP